MNKILYEKEFETSIKNFYVNRNFIQLYLYNGNLVTLEIKKPDSPKESIKFYSCDKIFFTRSYILCLKEEEVKIIDRASDVEKSVQINCELKDIKEHDKDLFLLCNHSVLKIENFPIINREKLFELEETYQDLLPFQMNGKLFFLLRSLWGITIVNHNGRLELFKTFGDLILKPQICSIRNIRGILIGSRNGWLYHLDFEGKINFEYSSSAGLTAFKSFEKKFSTFIIYANSNRELYKLVISNKTIETKIGEFDETIYEIELLNSKNERNLVAITSNKLFIIRLKAD